MTAFVAIPMESMVLQALRIIFVTFLVREIQARYAVVSMLIQYIKLQQVVDVID